MFEVSNMSISLELTLFSRRTFKYWYVKLSRISVDILTL